MDDPMQDNGQADDALAAALAGVLGVLRAHARTDVVLRAQLQVLGHALLALAPQAAPTTMATAALAPLAPLPDAVPAAGMPPPVPPPAVTPLPATRADYDGPHVKALAQVA